MFNTYIIEKQSYKPENTYIIEKQSYKPENTYIIEKEVKERWKEMH